jgi:CRP-like cAMP-binding protein
MFQEWMSVIGRARLFRSLSPEQLSVLLPCFQATVRFFARGEILAQAGQPQTRIGLVLSGEVMIQKEDYLGDRLIIGVFGSGELFGEVAAYAGGGEWPNTVIANADSQILLIPYDKISRPCCRVCDAHQILTRNMLHIVAAKAMMMNQRIAFLKRRGMREKLADFLFEQARVFGNKTFHISMNREEMADYLNVSRPSMSRELCRMKDEGLIDFYKSSFTIRDITQLRAVNNRSPAPS